ncbi:unnamed protein product [Ophioblennius macclurei]
MEGGVRSADERGAERSMDEYLRSKGLVRKRIAKDGSCLFRAVAEQVLHCQNLHTEIRARCVDFLKQNRSDYEAFIEGDFEDYLFKLRDPQHWVGEVEIHALSVMYKRDFLIFQEPGRPAVPITDNNFKDKVQLCFLNGNHYDSVYPESRVRNAALCQSILYELLYDGVFKVDRGLLASCHRAPRTSGGVLSDDGLAACRSSDDSDGGDSDEPLWVDSGTSSTSAKATGQSSRGRGRGRQLPERVRRSLNPALLRNVEYDVWSKTKRAQQKMDYCIAAVMHFAVGDRCQVRLESGGPSYGATVREVPPKNGQMSVFIEELGVRQVPLWSIQMAREGGGGWSTVGGRDRKLSNGDWEEKGRGRGRGKSASASSAASTAASAGSGGRVPKQHSRNADEHGKSGRKSLSSVEMAFGLTEELLAAREEEERNVALVEMQLRDEHSFPALGAAAAAAASEGGKKKGGEKRNKTKSPVEDVRPLTTPTGERPTCASPPAPKTSDPPSVAPPPVDPAPAPVGPAPSEPPAAELTFLGDSVLEATADSGPAPKTGAQSYASVAAPASPSPFAAPPPSSSSFPFLTPVLPPACMSPPPSSPTFIAPIAPSPTGFPRPAVSPPSPRFARSVGPLQDAPSAKPTPKAGSSPPQNQIQTSAPQADLQAQVSGAQIPIQTQSPAPAPQCQDGTIQSPAPPNQNQDTVLSKPQVQNPETMPSRPEIQNQIMQIQEGMPSRPQVQNRDAMPSRPQVQNPETMPSTVQVQVPETLALRPQIQNLDTMCSTPGIQSSAKQDHNNSLSGSQIQTVQPDPAPPYQNQMFPSTQIHFQSPGSQNQETRTPPVDIQSLAIKDQDTMPPRPHVHSQSPGLVPQGLGAMQTEALPPWGPTPMQLQQLPQVYQDLLYPGLPQGDKGEVAPALPYSNSKSGDDLPRDMNILRFFFNLGVKAYSMPMCPPYVYILPLMQTHFLQTPSPPRSPSPANPPARHPEAPPPPPFGQPAYPAPPAPPQHLPWQQLPPPRSSPYPARYPSPAPAYPVPPSSQGYHLGQVQGHPPYPPPVVPQYPPPSLGYQPHPVPDDLQTRQGSMEQRLPGLGHHQGPGLLDAPPPTASIGRAPMAATGFGGREAADNVSRPVMLMEAPLGNRPLVALLSDADRKEVALSGSRSSPGSPSQYRGLSMAMYAPQGPPAPHPTEENWEDPTHAHGRGSRGRGYRGGRGRSQRRRYPGDMGPMLSYTQFTPSQRGRGHDRGY